MGQERELKFRLDPAFHEALRRHPVLATLAPAPQVQQLQTWYFDTADHRLRQAGLALRVRHPGDGRRILCLKSSPAQGLRLARGEWEFPIGADTPSATDLARLHDTPLAAQGSAEALAGALGPVLGTRVQRTVWDVAWTGARLEVCLDEGQALGGVSMDAPSLPISELEIELQEGDWLAAFDLAWALAQDLPLHLSPTSKAELAARAAGLAPLQLPVLARELPRHQTGGKAMATVLQQSAALITVGADMLHADPQPQTVHQMRLQLRRLRVLLRLLQTMGPRSQAQACRWLRAEWRWAGQLLGTVRDVDVCQEHAQSLRDAAPFQSAVGPANDPLLENLARKRIVCLQALKSYLLSPRFGRVLLAQARWAECWESGAISGSDTPTATLAHRLLRFHRNDLSLHPRRWTELLAIWDSQSKSPLDAPWPALHALRLSAKQLRYTLEWLLPWVDSALGAEGAAWLKLTGNLQSDLGVALDTLRLASWMDESGALPPAQAAELRERWAVLAFEQARTGLNRALQAASAV
jgi:inorganic triphosphatase YgiF